MIRTVLEIQGEDKWKFEDNLKAALSQLGFEEKPSEDTIRWRHDLISALKAKGIDPVQLIEEYRGTETI